MRLRDKDPQDHKSPCLEVSGQFIASAEMREMFSKLLSNSGPRVFSQTLLDHIFIYTLEAAILEDVIFQSMGWLMIAIRGLTTGRFPVILPLPLGDFNRNLAIRPTNHRIAQAFW